MNSHHNTTKESGATLDLFRDKAQTQEDRVLWFMRKNRFRGFSPSELHQLCMPESPITSVRRAMSNLTRDGLLEKTTTKRTGAYGRPEFIWVLKR